MKNMKNRKQNIFQLFFPPDPGPTKGMAPVNFFLCSVLLAPSIWMDLAGCASIWVIFVGHINCHGHITQLIIFTFCHKNF